MSLVHARKLSICPGGAHTRAIHELDLEIPVRAKVAVVGPSGCGKSTLARALVGLEPRMTGSLRIGDVELVGADAIRWRAARRELALAWQDPLAALDPRATIADALTEARSLSGRAPLHDAELVALLERVCFPAQLCGRRPAQLSGGQRQRAALARALASEPRLLIADEVTSAIDRTLAIEICGELLALPESGTALLLITHDLSLLSDAFDEVLVLDRGVVVERGPSARMLARPEHALTRALVDAIPRLRRPTVASDPPAQ